MAIDLTQVIEGVVFEEYRNISADETGKKAGDSKQLLLKVDYSGLTLNDIFRKAFKADCITWQNANRKHYTKLENKSTINISAKSPGAQPAVDPETAMVAKLATMTAEEQVAYLQQLQEKAKK